MTQAENLIHPFEPVWDAGCRVLVLGTFPSVKSRQSALYYGHPQNRFWRMLGAVYHEQTPDAVEEKRALLLRHQIALWDVISRCEITGSADSSIKNAVPNDLPGLLARCPIEKVLLNGKTAEKLYLRHWRGLSLPYLALPSTSPANAAWSLERLVDAWGKALPCHVASDGR